MISLKRERKKGTGENVRDFRNYKNFYCNISDTVYCIRYSSYFFLRWAAILQHYSPQNGTVSYSWSDKSVLRIVSTCPRVCRQRTNLTSGSLKPVTNLSLSVLYIRVSIFLSRVEKRSQRLSVARNWSVRSIS